MRKQENKPSRKGGSQMEGENRTYEVTLEIEAPNREAVDKLLDRMYDHLTEKEYMMVGDPSSIKDLDERHFEERIRYVEDWHGEGEHYVFEGKHSDEEDWGLDTAFKLFDLDYKGHHEDGVLISYQALTKIRELRKMGVPFHFA